MEELALFQGAPWLPIAKKPSQVCTLEQKRKSGVGTQSASVNGLVPLDCGKQT